MGIKITKRLKIIFFILPLAIFPWSFDIFYLTKFAFLGLVWLWLLFDLKNELLTKSEIRLPKNIYLLPPVFVIISWLVSTIFAFDKSMAIFGAYGRYDGLLTIIIYISFFVIVSSYQPDIEDLRAIIKWLVLSSLIVSIIAIIQVIFAGTFEAPHGLDPKKAYSTIGNSVFLGGFCAITLPLAIYSFNIAKNKIKQIGSIIIVFLILVTLFLTQSRGAWIGTLAGIIFLIIFEILIRKKLGLRNLIIIFTILLIFISFLLLQPEINERITSIFDINNPTIKSRILIYQGALKTIGKYPLFGVGPDNFFNVFGKSRPVNWTKEVVQRGYIDKAHNDFLQWAVSTGITGLFFYIWCILTICIAFFRFLKEENNKQKQFLMIILMSSFLAYLVQAQFNFAVISISPIWWIIAGLIVGLNKNNIRLIKLKNIQVYLKKFQFLYIGILFILFMIFIIGWYADILFYSGISTALTHGGYQAAKKYESLTSYFNPIEHFYPYYFGYINYEGARLQDEQKNEMLHDSLKQLTKAIELNNYYTQAYLKRGDAYLIGESMGRSRYLQLAIEDFRKAIKLDQNIPNAWQGLGTAYIRSNDLRKGKKAWEKALNLYPEDYYKDYNKALYLIELGQKDEAKEILEDILKKKPKFTEGILKLHEIE